MRIKSKPTFDAKYAAAHKREIDAVAPKPDTNWAEICEKCHDGEIEPKECEYYGEPNGCNSPIYGQHPKSKPCGNSAAMREALEKATERLIRIVGCDHYTFHRNNHHCDFKTTMGECRNKNICETIFKAQAALAAPARNCDIAQDWLLDLYAKFKPPASVKREMPPEWVDAVMAFCRWLVATAQEGGAK